MGSARTRWCGFSRPARPSPNRRRCWGSARHAERDVVAEGTGERIAAGLDRPDAVEGEPRRSAPHDHIAAAQGDAARWARAPDPVMHEERRGEAERHRYDRLIRAPLVAVLM